LIIISNLALKLNGIAQFSIYATGVLEPLANEGYISNKFAHLNKDNISVRAAMLNLVITLFFSIIFLILPFIFSQEIKYDSILSVGAYSIMTVYILVLLATLTWSFKRKIILH
jgi:L-asparagine transporter-like permease